MSLLRLPEELPTSQNVNLEELFKVCRSISRLFCEKLPKIILLMAGHRKGHSFLIEDGVLTWLIANSNIDSTSTRRHIELALCHLAQNGKLTAKPYDVKLNFCCCEWNFLEWSLLW